MQVCGVFQQKRTRRRKGKDDVVVARNGYCYRAALVHCDSLGAIGEYNGF